MNSNPFSLSILEQSRRSKKNPAWKNLLTFRKMSTTSTGLGQVPFWVLLRVSLFHVSKRSFTSRRFAYCHAWTLWQFLNELASVSGAFWEALNGIFSLNRFWQNKADTYTHALKYVHELHTDNKVTLNTGVFLFCFFINDINFSFLTLSLLHDGHLYLEIVSIRIMTNSFKKLWKLHSVQDLQICELWSEAQ